LRRLRSPPVDASPERAAPLPSAAVDAFLAVTSKREVRDYADRALPVEVVRRILDAGRVAGSAMNRQQRRFLVVDDPALRERLAETVYAPSNVRGAALVVAIVVHGRGPTAFDAGRAGQNMMLAAWNDGVGSCPNGLAEREAASELLGIGEDEHVAIVLTFGYPARPVYPERRSPDEWIERADRKPFEEVVARL
jgi:nitroreductase